MNKKIVALLSIALLLVAFVAFASAETELTVSAPDHKGVITFDSVVSKSPSMTSVEKGVTLLPNRGATINLYFWCDGSGCHNMKTGSVVDRIVFPVKGAYLSTAVVSGGNWLSVRINGNGSISLSMKDNLTTKLRTGRVQVRDSQGLVNELVIKQSCKVSIVSATQLKGSYKFFYETASVRFQVTASSGNPGKALWLYDLNVEAWRRMKLTKAGKIFFHNNRPVNTALLYAVTPYRNMGGSTYYGPYDREMLVILYPEY